MGYDYATQQLSTYTFEYADGNAAASRGTGPDHLCKKVGYLPEDKFAYFAAANINYLSDDFDVDDVLAEAEYYFGDLAEFDDMSESDALSMIENLDSSGGDPMVYKISRDGTVIYHDEGLEEYVLEMFAEDEDYEYWDE